MRQGLRLAHCKRVTTAKMAVSNGGFFMRLTWVFAILLGLSFFTYMADASATINLQPNSCKILPRATRSPAADCKYESGDVKVSGHGSDWASAFEDAVTQCFEARRARFKAYRGVDSDIETSELLIDSCVNLTCS